LWEYFEVAEYGPLAQVRGFTTTVSKQLSNGIG